MIEVTDEMVDSAALAFTNNPTEAVYVIARRMITAAIKTYEANKPKPEPKFIGYISMREYKHAVDNNVSCTLFVPQRPIVTHDLVKLYTTPPTRESLSDSDIEKLRHKDEGQLNFVTLRQFRVIARAIEQAHGIGVTK